MSKNNKKDSTTDFFLEFMSKEKRETRKENKKKNETNFNDEENLDKKEKIAKIIYQAINTVNSALDKMLQSNLSIKILSFLLAAILLFTVRGSFDAMLTSPTSGDYIDDVPIQVENLQSDYEVIGLPSEVSVGLVGSSVDMYATKLTKSYSVYVDLAGLGEGEHTIELKARDFNSNLKVLIVPQTVTIRIAQKVTRTFDLQSRLINTSKLDSTYSVSVDSMAHDSVEVRGTQDALDNINSVQALVDVSGVTKAFSQDAVIRAYDRSGERVNVEIVPETVSVSCSVSTYSKVVPIIANYTGKVANGYGVDNVEFSKNEVRIYGDKSKLSTVEYVSVDIDISDLTDEKEYTKLVLNSVDGINRMSLDTVDATVSVSPVATTQ